MRKTPSPRSEQAERRRLLLRRLAAAGLFGAAGLTGLIRQALAMGTTPRRQIGIHRLEGQVTFNGRAAQVGDVVQPPLEVVTGERSLAVFSTGGNAYLIRAHSRVRFASDAEGRPDILVQSGKLLSVFEKGHATLRTPTAVAGIRGTGVYVEVEPARSYVCLCYGEIRLATAGDGVVEHLATRHHEAPRWVYADRMEPAGVVNHSDAELVLLEGLTGRLPPFYGDVDRLYGGGT